MKGWGREGGEGGGSWKGGKGLLNGRVEWAFVFVESFLVTYVETNKNKKYSKISRSPEGVLTYP